MLEVKDNVMFVQMFPLRCLMCCGFVDCKVKFVTFVCIGVNNA